MSDSEPLRKHKRELIRQKAVLVLHRFYTRGPPSISHLAADLNKTLCDKDPGVMVATLNVFFAMRNDKLPMLKDYSKTFSEILRQIVDRKLPRDFDYHKVPAPWVQIKLLKLMALVGADDQAASQPMYEVVQNCLMRAEGQGSAAYAVFFSQQI